MASWVDNYYARVSTLSMPFHEEFVLHGESAAGRGRLWVRRPGRFRYECLLDETDTAVAVSDGDRVLNDDIHGHVAYWYQSADQWDRLFGLLTGTRELGRHYDVALDECAGLPRDAVCIRITPRVPDAGYIQQWLGVSTSESTRGAIVWIRTHDASLMVTTIGFPIAEQEVNGPVDERLLALVPPANAVDITSACDAVNLPAAGRPSESEVLELLARLRTRSPE